MVLDIRLNMHLVAEKNRKYCKGNGLKVNIAVKSEDNSFLSCYFSWSSALIEKQK